MYCFLIRITPDAGVTSHCASVKVLTVAMSMVSANLTVKGKLDA